MLSVHQCSVPSMRKVIEYKLSELSPTWPQIGWELFCSTKLSLMRSTRTFPIRDWSCTPMSSGNTSRWNNQTSDYLYLWRFCYWFWPSSLAPSWGCAWLVQYWGPSGGGVSRQSRPRQSRLGRRWPWACHPWLRSLWRWSWWTRRRRESTTDPSDCVITRVSSEQTDILSWPP